MEPEEESVEIRRRMHLGGMLGEGGMGRVYEGFESGLGSHAAIKFLREELLEKPVYHSDTGRYSIPFTLTITHGNESGTLYYTTDGADPRLTDGRVSPVGGSQ